MIGLASNTSDTGGKTWHISEKVEGNGFTIRLSSVTPEELEFDYWILLVEQGNDQTPMINDQPDPYCGDGELYAGEECDDGNLVDGDGCDATCMIEPLEEAIEPLIEEPIAEEPIVEEPPLESSDEDLTGQAVIEEPLVEPVEEEPTSISEETI